MPSDLEDFLALIRSSRIVDVDEIAERFKLEEEPRRALSALLRRDRTLIDSLANYPARTRKVMEQVLSAALDLAEKDFVSAANRTYNYKEAAETLDEVTDLRESSEDIRELLYQARSSVRQSMANYDKAFSRIQQVAQSSKGNV